MGERDPDLLSTVRATVERMVTASPVAMCWRIADMADVDCRSCGTLMDLRDAVTRVALACVEPVARERDEATRYAEDREKHLLTVVRGGAVIIAERDALAARVRVLEEKLTDAYRRCDEWTQKYDAEMGQQMNIMRKLAYENGRLKGIGHVLLGLMNAVPVDPSLGDETDRVFSYAEFEPLRQALTPPKPEATDG